MTLRMTRQRKEVLSQLKRGHVLSIGQRGDHRLAVCELTAPNGQVKIVKRNEVVARLLNTLIARGDLVVRDPGLLPDIPQTYMWHNSKGRTNRPEIADV